MIETISILIVFFMLVVFGLIFYSKVMKGSYAVKMEEKAQLDAIKLAEKASSLPELQYSQENIAGEGIDIYKLRAASVEMMSPENRIHYYDFLGFSTITIEEIYPEAKSYPLYDRYIDDFTDNITTNIPMTIYDPKTKTNAFAVMVVSMYIK